MVNCARRSFGFRRVPGFAVVRVAACLVLASLGGCASAPTGGDGDAMIAPDVRFHVPPPGALGYSVDAAQLVTAHYGDRTIVFQAQLEVTKDKLTMVGLDDLGRRALTIVASGGTVEVDAAPWLPKDLRAANILADIALVYWPQQAVQEGLLSSTAVVRTGVHDRSISAGGNEIVHIDYDGDPRQAWPRMAHYRNLAFKYDLELRSSVTPR